MHDMEDPDLEGRLASLRYRIPPLETVWSPTAIARRRPTRRRVAVWLALAAALSISAGVVAGGSGWFNQFAPSVNCAQGEPTCGSDAAQVGIIVDHTSDVTAVNVLVKDGLSRVRLREIAVATAAQQTTHRTIVYLLRDLPSGSMNANFSALPPDDATAAPLPPVALRPFLVLTYDVGPKGATETLP
jgi:hypothetical protein